MNISSAQTLIINGVIADFGSETLRDGSGSSIDLRPQAFAVLRYMSENANRLVTKDELMQAVWPGVAVTDDSLVQCIHEIRSALGDEKHAVLKTVPKRGYRLNLATKATPGLSASRPDRVTPIATTPALIAGIAVLALIAIGAIYGFTQWRDQTSGLSLSEKPSIAVLPFANMSGDPQQDYFADGMTDSLITDLSRVSELFVIARNSTFSYKGKAINPKQVARELGVRYVLEGSVQRSGDSVRINAQLIDATTDGHAWADRYDGSMSDVFALQDKVTHSIVKALTVSLTGPEEQMLAQQETKVPAAYDAFLRGWEHYRRTTPEDFAKSIPYFEEAIRLDPDYGRAYAALALVYVFVDDWKWSGSLGLSATEVWNRIHHYLGEAARRPTSTSHQAAANYWIKMDGYGLSVLASYKMAIACDPSDSWNYAYLAWIQISMGQESEAISNIKTAMRLDPHYPPIFGHILGLVYLGSGEYQEAAKSLEQAVRLNPDNEYSLVGLGAAYGYLGAKQQAQDTIARYNKIRATRGDIPLTLATLPNPFAPNYTSNTVLRKGLRLAGVPDRLQTSEFAAKNRMQESEIRKLLFGHRLQGRTISNDDEHTAEITTEGIARITGDWGSMSAAVTSFKNDEVCFSEASDGGQFCASILRNPDGTRATHNEYIWLDGTGAFPFSQVQ